METDFENSGPISGSHGRPRGWHYQSYQALHPRQTQDRPRAQDQPASRVYLREDPGGYAPRQDVPLEISRSQNADT